MDVEVLPDEMPATEKKKRSTKKVTLEPGYLETVQEVNYGEQDVRTPVDSNGWVAHLVEPAIGDDGSPPPELPEEPEYHDHGKEDKPASIAMRLTVAGLYLSFGGLLVYAGAVVLHDLWKERNK